MNRTLLFVMLAFPSSAIISSCTEPSAPQCREGQHLTGRHCCPKGEEWVPARSRCINLEPKASKEPVAPAPAASKPAKSDRCIGEWTGKIRNSEGDRGKVIASIEALKPGTINRPHSKTCGQIRESWPEGHCRMRLSRCSRNGPLLIASGRPSDGSSCEPPTSVVLQCSAGDDSIAYRRNEDGLVTNGKLQPLGAEK